MYTVGGYACLVVSVFVTVNAILSLSYIVLTILIFLIEHCFILICVVIILNEHPRFGVLFGGSRLIGRSNISSMSQQHLIPDRGEYCCAQVQLLCIFSCNIVCMLNMANMLLSTGCHVQQSFLRAVYPILTRGMHDCGTCTNVSEILLFNYYIFSSILLFNDFLRMRFSINNANSYCAETPYSTPYHYSKNIFLSWSRAGLPIMSIERRNVTPKGCG